MIGTSGVHDCVVDNNSLQGQSVKEIAYVIANEYWVEDLLSKRLMK